jgi:hypothetical protein
VAQVNALSGGVDSYSSFSDSEDEDPNRRILERMGSQSAVLPWDPVTDGSDPSGAAQHFGTIACTMH